MNILRKEIAQQFIDQEIDDLSSYQEIEPDAAESLSRHQGGLDLRGLTELSDAAAESLSRHGKAWGL